MPENPVLIFSRYRFKLEQTILHETYFCPEFVWANIFHPVAGETLFQYIYCLQKLESKDHATEKEKLEEEIEKLKKEESERPTIVPTFVPSRPIVAAVDHESQQGAEPEVITVEKEVIVGK